jgi:hypothetical protein
MEVYNISFFTWNPETKFFYANAWDCGLHSMSNFVIWNPKTNGSREFKFEDVDECSYIFKSTIDDIWCHITTDPDCLDSTKKHKEEFDILFA